MSRAARQKLEVSEVLAAEGMASLRVEKELLQRETLFVGENELDQLGKITALLGHPDPDEWPE